MRLNMTKELSTWDTILFPVAVDFKSFVKFLKGMKRYVVGAFIFRHETTAWLSLSFPFSTPHLEETQEERLQLPDHVNGRGGGA